MMKLIFLGPPGAGKGTQAAVISKALDIPTISTGDMLRAAIKEGTDIGKRAKGFMDAGQLVPDEVIIGIVQERLAKDDCQKGFILDGVPRTIAQAQALEDAGVRFDYVLSLEIADEAIVERMGGRRVCAKCGATYHLVNIPPKTAGVCDKCGGELKQRHDDEPDTVRSRLAVYHKETEPLKAFYAERGTLREIPGDKTPEETTQAIKKVLGA